MKESVVADSTCLITLERIGKTHLLAAQFDPVIVPPAVSRETGMTFPWLQAQDLADQSAASALKLILDDGESEAIALSQETGLRIILDDRKARIVARDLGLNIIGTIGLLIRAKRQGHCDAIQPLLVQLEANGFHVSQALKAEALRLAGERT